MIEIADGFSVDDVKKATGCDVNVSYAHLTGWGIWKSI